MKPGTGADGGKASDAWPVPSFPGVPCALNCTDQGQWRQGRAQSSALLAPHPPVSSSLVKLMLHHKTSPAGRRGSLSYFVQIGSHSSKARFSLGLFPSRGKKLNVNCKGGGVFFCFTGQRKFPFPTGTV